MGAPHSIRVILLALFAAVAAWGEEPARSDVAYLADTYTYYRSGPGGSRVEVRDTTRPVLILSFRYAIPEADLRGRPIVELLGADGQPIPGLEFFEGMGGAGGPEGRHRRCAMYLLPSDPPRLGRTVVVRYSRTAPVAARAGADGAFAPVTGAALQDATVAWAALPLGKQVDADGGLTDGAAGYGAARPGDGPEAMRRLWRNGDLVIEPLTGGEHPEIGLAYRLDYDLETGQLGSLGFYRVDLRVDGRLTRDAADQSLQGFAEGALDARVMLVPGSERKLPIGLKVGGGYEADERFAVTYGVLHGVAVATVPFVTDLALVWQQLAGIDRPVAPPFVSAGWVLSRTSADQAVEEDRSRLEVEAGWTVPVAERFDLKGSFRCYAYDRHALRDRHLWQGEVLYYLDDQHRTAVTMTLEEGARAVLPEIAATAMVGLSIKGF
jgi:hypothetical protein